MLLKLLIKIIVLVALAYFIFLQLLVLNTTSSSLSGLQVLNLSKQNILIVVDGAEFEISPNSDYALLNKIQPGVRKVEIINKDNLRYPKYELDMNFSSNTNNFVAYSPGPNDVASFGWSLEALGVRDDSSQINLEVISDLPYQIIVNAEYDTVKNIPPNTLTTIYSISKDNLKKVSAEIHENDFADMKLEIFDTIKTKVLGGTYRLRVKLLELPI